MSDLTGKNILITGGTRGLGKAYALHLAKLGANIGLIYRDLYSYKDYDAEAASMTCDTILDELAQLNVQVAGAKADVTISQEVSSAIHQIQEQLGSIDAIICNAGGGQGPLTEGKPSTVNLEDYRATIEKNLDSTVYTLRAIAPIMKAQGYGKIITVSSHVGQQVNSDASYSHYCAAKAAIIQYTKALAQEMGPYGVTANCIAPGYILTARLQEKFLSAGSEKLLRNVALGRFGTPEDCANVVEFLVSHKSDYISGALIEINGGTTGKMFMG